MASGKQEDWLYKNVKDLRKRLQDTERSLQNLHSLDERYPCLFSNTNVFKRLKNEEIVRFKKHWKISTFTLKNTQFFFKNVNDTETQQSTNRTVFNFQQTTLNLYAQVG